MNSFYKESKSKKKKENFYFFYLARGEWARVSDFFLLREGWSK